MIEPSLHRLHLDPKAAQPPHDLVRKLRTTFIWKLVLVVVSGEAAEVISNIRVLGCVDLYTIRAVLPVR